MPRIPPVNTTHSFGDMATATRIESIAKTMSVSSTFTTVDQNGVMPSIEEAFGGVRRVLGVARAEEVVAAQYERDTQPRRASPTQADQVDGQQRRDRPEGEGPDNAVARGPGAAPSSAGPERGPPAPWRCRRSEALRAPRARRRSESRDGVITSLFEYGSQGKGPKA